MTGRKKIGVFLVVAGILVLAASGLEWRKHAPALAQIHTDSAVLEDSVKRVHARLVQQSLLQQGLQASQATLPDSVRRYGAGQMMQVSSEYNKAIRRLDMQERDIRLEIASLKRDATREHADAKKRTLPVAAAGAAIVLVGIVLTAIPGRRVGA
jgi:hypothetical protein